MMEPLPVGLPAPIAVELDRIEHRWAGLPLPVAERWLGPVHESAGRILASDPASGAEALPQVGPGSAMDQLRVVVFDLFTGLAEAAVPVDADGSAAIGEAVATELEQLRRMLASAQV